MLSLLAVKPLTATELARRLPYSKHTLYKAASELEREGLVERTRSGRAVVLSLSRGHEAWMLGRLLRASVGHGIDPEELMQVGTRRLVAALDRPMTLRELRDATGLSYDVLHRAIGLLVPPGALIKTRGRPLVVERAEGHPVLAILDEMGGRALDHGTRLASATADVAVSVLPPTVLEGRLYSAIDGPVYITGTGLLTKGTDRLEVLMTGPDPASPEELFMRLLGTPEGVEDLCPQLLRSGRLDLGALARLAVSRGEARELGAYLDVLGRLGMRVPDDILKGLEAHVRGRRVPFPRWEDSLPDAERDRDVERRWRVEYRLDVGAIMHTVRAL